MLGFFFPFLQKLIIDEKESYILVNGKFSRNRKMDFEAFVYYILGNRGKTSVLELDEFNNIKNDGDDEMVVTKQDLSKQRSYLNPLIFKDTIRNALKVAYSPDKYPLETFKGYYVFAEDGSQIELPNTQQTKEEFDVPLRALKETDTPKARISVLSDVKNDFIIDSTISSMTIGEEVLAYENIEKSSEIVDFSKSIVIFDRYYVSAELIIQLLEKESHFIFRLKSDTYIKERKQMKTDDEWIDINLNRNRKQNIKSEKIKEKVEEFECLNLRVVNIPLKTGEIESLLTNLPEKIATSQELKELYGERWEIEKGYDVLKNKIHIENFSGKRRICIEQDFYAQTLMYNMLIDFKTECNKKINETEKYQDLECEYKVNINILAGKIKINLFKIVFAKNAKARRKFEQQIYNLAMKNLIKSKKKPSTTRKKSKRKKFPYNNRKNF
jgi:hypothetical protein